MLLHGACPLKGKITNSIQFSYYKINFLFRPTMIKYGIDNIRDLVGHKVNLKMVQDNPICRLDKY